jgi:hypothetical protein
MLTGLVVLLNTLTCVLGQMVAEDMSWDELTAASAFHLDAVVNHPAQSELEKGVLTCSIEVLARFATLIRGNELLMHFDIWTICQVDEHP